LIALVLVRNEMGLVLEKKRWGHWGIEYDNE